MRGCRGRQYHVAAPKTGTYIYYPGTSAVPEHSAVNTHVGSWRALAEVELADRDAHGVVFAQGSRFGGHALFLADRKLYYVYNFLGIGEEQTWVADAPAPGRHILGVDFVHESVDEDNQPNGTTSLYVGDQVVATGPMRMMALQFSLCGEGLCIGYDGGDAVSRRYAAPSHLVGARIAQVEFSVAEEAYLDTETRLASLLARD